MRAIYLTACAIVIWIMQTFGHNLPQTDSVLAKNRPQIFAPGIISLENEFERLGNRIKIRTQETEPFLAPDYRTLVIFIRDLKNLQDKQRIINWAQYIDWLYINDK